VDIAQGFLHLRGFFVGKSTDGHCRIISSSMHSLRDLWVLVEQTHLFFRDVVGFNVGGGVLRGFERWSFISQR
jgi:hypothetical protein